MSHFTVAVFSRTGTEEEIDELLEPFYEQVEDDSPYAEFISEGTLEDAKRIYAEELEENPALRVSELIKDDGYEIVGNEYGYFGNPNAKWDWYMIGGRWTGTFKLKPGHYGRLGERSWMNKAEDIPNGKCDSAMLKDIDFSPDIDKYNHALRFWEVVVDGEPLKSGENEDDFDSFWNKEYYLEMYGDKKTYAEDCSLDFIPFAALTENGCWHEEGEMGWFGLSTSDKESKESFAKWFMNYLNETMQNNPELYITMVDCHI